MNALYFYSSVWIYAFIHKCFSNVIRLQHSFINISRRHKIWHHSKHESHPTAPYCKMSFSSAGKSLENPVWYARIYLYYTGVTASFFNSYIICWIILAMINKQIWSFSPWFYLVTYFLTWDDLYNSTISCKVLRTNFGQCTIWTFFVRILSLFK